MTEEKICLASDNFTSVYPLIIEAITEANESHSPAYGLVRSKLLRAANTKCKK